MRYITSMFLLLCLLLGISGCGKNKEIKYLISDKGKQLIEEIDVVPIERVIDDIKNINLNPDYDGNEYTDHIKTYSGLDADVNYFTDSAGLQSVSVFSGEYNVFINIVDKNDILGFSDTTIILLSDIGTDNFKCCAQYYYNDDCILINHIDYYEDGDYVRFNFFVNQNEEINAYKEILIENKTPSVSKDILTALMSDTNYKEIAIEIDNGCKWYQSRGKWSVKANVCVYMDSVEQAEEYLKKNNIKGYVVNEGEPVIEFRDTILQINTESIINNQEVLSYITEETDSIIYRSVTFDSTGAAVIEQ